MTWVIWRQHRAEGLIVLVVLVVIGGFLLITGLGFCQNGEPKDSQII